MVKSQLVDERKHCAMKSHVAAPVARLALILAVAVAMPARAAPPAGHPSPAEARDILLFDQPPGASGLPNEGRVLDVIHANEFTYLEVDRADGKVWIAAPRTEIRPGARIDYEDGAVMQNFYSKLLKRTFPSVMFIKHLVVTTQP